MNQQEYQGWTNYSTWLVNMHIDQTHGAYRDLAAIRYYGRFVDMFHVAMAFESIILQLLSCDEFLNFTHSQVNWQEIADFWNDKEFDRLTNTDNLLCANMFEVGEL